MQSLHSLVPGKGDEFSECLTFLQSDGPRETSQEIVESFLTRDSIFFENEKEPTTKLFDDDDWIRSLTEAAAITAGVPEGQVTYANANGTAHDQSVDPQRGATRRDGRIRAKIHVKAALGTAMRQVGVGSQGGAEGPSNLLPAQFP